MKIFIGLGNPGKEYENTRHNVGFLVLDKLLSHKEIAPVGEKIQLKNDKRFKSQVAERSVNGEKLIFVKPQTFMNNSGDAVFSIVEYFKTDISKIFVLSDDVDLPIGTARIKLNGGSAGQLGLQSIIDSIGSDNFKRVRIGISGKIKEETPIETKDYVLSKIEDKEKIVIDKVISEVVGYLVQHIGSKEEIKANSFKVDNQRVI